MIEDGRIRRRRLPLLAYNYRNCQMLCGTITNGTQRRSQQNTRDHTHSN